MNPKFKLTVAVSLCILVYAFFLYGRNGDIHSVSNPTSISLLTHYPTATNILSPSATYVVIVTPTLNNLSVISPDELFSLLDVPALSTPSSVGSCEHLSQPQVLSTPGEWSILSGRFLLCPSRSWPWVNMAMDLDTGTLVSVDSESADMVMEYAHVPVDGTISYDVQGVNEGHIAEIETDTLNYASCENRLLSMEKNDPGVFDIHEGTIACVMTSEGDIAVIRVEKIYPLDLQSVEFSFAILGR